MGPRVQFPAHRARSNPLGPPSSLPCSTICRPYLPCTRSKLTRTAARWAWPPQIGVAVPTPGLTGWCVRVCVGALRFECCSRVHSGIQRSKSHQRSKSLILAACLSMSMPTLHHSLSPSHRSQEDVTPALLTEALRSPQDGCDAQSAWEAAQKMFVKVDEAFNRCGGFGGGEWEGRGRV